MFPLALKEQIASACLFFESALKQNRLSHAYLLCGTDSALKDSLAREITKILNCTNVSSSSLPGAGWVPPCGKCSNCLWIAENTHPELPIVLEPDLEKSKKGVVLVKQVQSLLSKIHNKSQYFRVIIIKKAEMEFLPAESANSLLKTIEEPNPRTLFLLYANDKEQVLPTIESRCQAVNLPSPYLEMDALKGQELFDELMTKKLNYFEAAQLTSKCIDNYKDNELIEALDELIAVCLKKSMNESKVLWLAKIQSIEKAKSRIKGFCSPKASLEEMFWSVSNK